MKVHSIPLLEYLTVLPFLPEKLARSKFHNFMVSVKTGNGIELIYGLNVKKNGDIFNNPQNNAFRVISTKTGSSETTTIAVTDIISSNLSYSQTNFSATISSATIFYADLSDRRDLRSKKFVASKGRSKNFTVKVECQIAQHICKKQTNIKAHPVISLKVNINGI